MVWENSILEGRGEASPTYHIVATEECRRNVNTDTRQTDSVIKIEDGDGSSPSTLMTSQDADGSQALTIHESCQANKIHNLEVMKKIKVDAAVLAITN